MLFPCSVIILVFVPVPPIRHRCNCVQSTPRGHPHRVRPPPFPHITLVGEDDYCAHHVDEQKSQRRSSDHHLLRRGGEHRQGERPLLQVSAQPRTAVVTGCWFGGSGSDCKRFFIFHFLASRSDCAPKLPAPQAMDDAAAKKLWDLSASMVGLA